MADHADGAMQTLAFDAEAYVRAAAPAVGLPLNDEEAEAVAAQIGRTARFAAIVSAALDDPKATPAPVFAPNRATTAGEPS